MKTLILKIEYEGTNYAGWQRQANANSIQETIEKSFYSAVGQIINLIGAGRTDAGVHSRGMIASCSINNDFKIPEDRIPTIINAKLPGDIQILNTKIIDKKFNARFDAIAREYSYTIALTDTVFSRKYSEFIKYNLDWDKLKKSAEIFIGQHNFTTFSKNNPDTKNYVCNVEISSWYKENNHWIYKIKADRFVYGMVRAVVGAMIDMARGKRTIDEVKNALDLKDRKLISPLAVAKGLVLEKIYYPYNLNFFS